jgi:hypothetical protein
VVIEQVCIEEEKMKKITFLMLAVPLVFAACSATNNPPSNSNTEASKSTEAQTSESLSRLEAIEKRLATVEAQLAKIVATTPDAAQTQLGSNRKLSQDKAEKAIKVFASTHSFDLRGGGNGCSFNVQSIASIELSQFSDTEATADVLLKCARGGIVFKFVFQKDVDNQWFLMKIASTSSGYQVDYDAIAPYQNLKVPVR